MKKSLESSLAKINITADEFKTFVKAGNTFEQTVFEDAWNALIDDINVPKALGKIFSALTNVQTKQDLQAFAGLTYALGIDLFENEQNTEIEIPSEIVELAQQRWNAKKDRNFALADELRAKIKEAGWEVFDKKDGFDIKKI